LHAQVSQATHNIFAYRFTADASGIIYHDCDDDGESAAGARMAEMMRLMGASGVAVIVSRWYGGVNLGPDRFKYICNSARTLLETCGYGFRGSGSSTFQNGSVSASSSTVRNAAGSNTKANNR
jgi:hypothetical protein